MDGPNLTLLTLTGGTPGANAFARKADDRTSIVVEEPDPCPFAHLREIDAAEKEPCDQMAMRVSIGASRICSMAC